jgi:hypothetical protein
LTRILFKHFPLPSLLFLSLSSFGQDVSHAGTVKAGIYITSIHDIDFRKQEYSIDFWLWLKYSKRDSGFNFRKNLELPQAKSAEMLFDSVNTDNLNDSLFVWMKLQCVMKDSWGILAFPFDRQNLRFSIENSQYDSDSLVFVADTVGQKMFDSLFTLRGWHIDSCRMMTRTTTYQTSFGDTPVEPSKYSSLRVKMVIRRHASGLFLKIFIGMYIAFVIAFICFFIPEESTEARYNLSVGALFAVVGNKYIIDSSLPETNSFTMVDWLHSLTLIFIVFAIAVTIYSSRFIKNDLDRARKFDRKAAWIGLTIYVVLNFAVIFTLKVLGN